MAGISPAKENDMLTDSEIIEKQKGMIWDLRFLVAYLYVCLFIALCLVAGLSGVLFETF